jgi:beta-glucosidase
MLEAKEKAGLFKEPFTKESSLTLDRAAARRVAQKSIVLLKNDGVLPLAKSKKVAIVGELAGSKIDMLGEWKGNGQEQDVVTVRDAIRSV